MEDDPAYVVRRTIEDVEFSASHVDEIRESVRHDMVDEGHETLDPEVVEERVQERLLEIARDNTLYSQGDNRLHTDINHEPPEEPE